LFDDDHDDDDMMMMMLSKTGCFGGFRGGI